MRRVVMKYLKTSPVAGLCCAVLVLTSASAVRADDQQLTPQAISDHVSDEFLTDDAVNSASIDVSTNEQGIVELTGTVTNLLEKDRATRIARAVKGVRAVVNRIDVIPVVTRTDSQLETAVETALLNDAATESYEIQVEASEGNVRLVGAVDSWQERELAGLVAKGVNGVTGINNEITIQYPAERPDSELRKDIEQALHWNVFVDDMLIDVDVNDEMVTLSGTVGSATEKTQAQHEAWMAGASDVDASELTVAGWARNPQLREKKYVMKTAAEIEDAVNDAMQRDPRVFSFEVTPEVVGSVVTLRGTVDNLKAKRAAAQDARGTVGVSRVINRIKVRTPGDIDDIDMELAIRDMIKMDPYLERFEVVTDVVNGVAHLYGTVDNHFEKRRAEDIASRAYGVSEVKSHIATSDFEASPYDPYVDFDDRYIDGGFDNYVGTADPLASDADVLSEIRSEMWWSPFVDSDEINVTVDDGVATLTGVVDSWSEKLSAAENAYEGGASEVVNNLTIGR